ncbi:MAG: hypothetical protein M1821_003263 [Bathelium mastoideum]|nr:MAG: hypothetical protein M1821_003263 [Bathelium mastoideum]KAI9689379.1 MAG: hypothetical protein M1822_010030 [Bathelium mastoideum]
MEPGSVISRCQNQGAFRAQGLGSRPKVISATAIGLGVQSKAEARNAMTYQGLGEQEPTTEARCFATPFFAGGDRERDAVEQLAKTGTAEFWSHTTRGQAQDQSARGKAPGRRVGVEGGRGGGARSFGRWVRRVASGAAAGRGDGRERKGGEAEGGQQRAGNDQGSWASGRAARWRLGRVRAWAGSGQARRATDRSETNHCPASPRPPPAHLVRAAGKADGKLLLTIAAISAAQHQSCHRRPGA